MRRQSIACDASARGRRLRGPGEFVLTIIGWSIGKVQPARSATSASPPAPTSERRRSTTAPGMAVIRFLLIFISSDAASPFCIARARLLRTRSHDDRQARYAQGICGASPLASRGSAVRRRACPPRPRSVSAGTAQAANRTREWTTGARAHRRIRGLRRFPTDSFLPVA